MVAMISVAALLSIRQAPPDDPPKLPDVLIVSTSELADAEKALANRRVPADRLIWLPHKRLHIACYGILARDLQATERYARVAADLAKSGTLNAEGVKVLKGAMENSPFRDTIRSRSQEGQPMTIRLERTTVATAVGTDGKSYLLPLQAKPLTQEVPWESDTKLTDLSTKPLTFDSPNRRPVRGLACIVRPTYPAAARVETMAEALRVYSSTLRRTLQDMRTAEGLEETTLNLADQTKIRQLMERGYEELGFTSPEEAFRVLGNAQFSKNSYVKVQVRFANPDGKIDGFSWALIRK